jgi:hypothetical protein
MTPDFHVGADYAYLPPGVMWVNPLRVTVLEAPFSTPGGYHVRVRVHHPDLISVDEDLPAEVILNGWDERPSSSAWPGYIPEDTWAQIAEKSYARVCEQRELARRLTALGIPRKLKHYAKAGGDSVESGEVDTRLTLLDEEIDYLLALAERGKEGSTTEES